MAETLEAGCGRIKIDLSVTSYEIDEGYINGRRKIRKLKYPGLSQIIRILEKTGATVLRTSARGRFTVIDYTTI